MHIVHMDLTKFYWEQRENVLRLRDFLWRTFAHFFFLENMLTFVRLLPRFAYRLDMKR